MKSDNLHLMRKEKEKDSQSSIKGIDKALGHTFQREYSQAVRLFESAKENMGTNYYLEKINLQDAWDVIISLCESDFGNSKSEELRIRIRDYAEKRGIELS